MKSLSIALAAAAAFVPATASAEEWWLVAGGPGSREVWFVDAESIVSSGATARFELMQATALGTAPAVVTVVSCGDTSAADPNAEAVRRFVCATPEERMALGAMLGSLTPELAANAVLGAGEAPERFAGVTDRQ